MVLPRLGVITSTWKVTVRSDYDQPTITMITIPNHVNTV